MEHWWNGTEKGTGVHGEKLVLVQLVPPISLTWNVPGSNSRFRDEKQANNLPLCGMTACLKFWEAIYKSDVWLTVHRNSVIRQLLMMGTWLSETCWANIRREIKNTKSDIWLVFLIHTQYINICILSHTKRLVSDTKTCRGNAAYKNSSCWWRHINSVGQQDSNVRKTQQSGSFMQPLLQLKSNEYYTTWVRVFIALVTQHATRMRHIANCGLPRSAVFSPHYLINGTFFGKMSSNTKCVFWFSLQRLSETFLILRRNDRYMIENVYRSSCTVPVIHNRSQWNLNFLYRFSKYSQISNFMKILPVEAESFHPSGRTEGHDEAVSRFSKFCERASKQSLIICNNNNN